MDRTKEMTNEAFDFIRTRTTAAPRIGIILGTGLGSLVDELRIDTTIEYGEIPHFPVSTVEAHEGRLIFGGLAGAEVVVMQGRFHYYEGYDLKQVTFPVRVMRRLGVDTLMISNAAGGLNPQFRRGDIMVIADHVNLIGDNPLIGPNDDTLGPRFPDMSEPYSEDLIRLAEETALDRRIHLKKGVFAAMAGPTFETKAEYRFLRTIGADAVGMSTVPETIVAVHAGMRVLGFSLITDECFPDALKPLDLPEVIRAANEAEPKLRAMIGGVVGALNGAA